MLKKTLTDHLSLIEKDILRSKQKLAGYEERNDQHMIMLELHNQAYLSGCKHTIEYLLEVGNKVTNETLLHYT